MGKLIMCTGKLAEKPYRFKATGVLVYSIEELCYYIQHNVDIITEELFDTELITFLREEIGLTERAEFIEKLLKQKAGLKDIIVSIFCSADYFNEQEIKAFLLQMDEILNLNIAQRKKRHADYCLANQQYKEAMREYRFILNSKESQELNSIEYGDILHNIATLMVRTGSFLLAAEYFREAYDRNAREESLKQYLYAIKVANHEGFKEKEPKLLVMHKELSKEIEHEVNQITLTEELSPNYYVVETLKELREKGKMKEFNQLADKLIDNLKQKYRSDSL